GPDALETDVERGPVKPCAETGFAAPAGQFLVRAEEHFLGNIERGFLISQDLQAHVDDAILVRFQEHAEGAGIASLKACNQSAFRFVVHSALSTQSRTLGSRAMGCNRCTTKVACSKG